MLTGATSLHHGRSIFLLQKASLPLICNPVNLGLTEGRFSKWGLEISSRGKEQATKSKQVIHEKSVTHSVGPRPIPCVVLGTGAQKMNYTCSRASRSLCKEQTSSQLSWGTHALQWGELSAVGARMRKVAASDFGATVWTAVPFTDGELCPECSPVSIPTTLLPLPGTGSYLAHFSLRLAL